MAIARATTSSIKQGFPKSRSLLAGNAAYNPLPLVPTIGTATAGVASASVTFTPNGAGPIATSFTVTSSPGSFTGSGSASPITVSGLTNGTSYTFKVHATNAAGNSAESSSSNAITPVAPPTVTGGTLTSDATYYYRTFKASGTLGVSVATLLCDVLTIAGGGSAGGLGGGGAGGILYSPNQTFSSDMTVTVGAGGSGASVFAGYSGSDSSCGSLIATGGGGGGGPRNSTYSDGQPGGSGGGGGASGAGDTHPGGSGVGGQGNNGGSGGGLNSNNTIATGGGGGAASAGGNGNTGTGVAGKGGNGTNAYSAWASATNTGSGGYYGAGGGGYGSSSGNGVGGTGGGYVDNSGNGGSYPNNGNSGVVIVRYTRSQVGG